MGWVRLPPYNISQKVQVVEDFREKVATLLSGQGKGDGGCRQSRGGGALATGGSEVHKRQQLPHRHLVPSPA